MRNTWKYIYIYIYYFYIRESFIQKFKLNYITGLYTIHIHHNRNKYFSPIQRIPNNSPLCFHCVSRYSYNTVVLDIKPDCDIVDYRDARNRSTSAPLINVKSKETVLASRIFYIHIYTYIYTYSISNKKYTRCRISTFLARNSALNFKDWKMKEGEGG